MVEGQNKEEHQAGEGRCRMWRLGRRQPRICQCGKTETTLRPIYQCQRHRNVPVKDDVVDSVAGKSRRPKTFWTSLHPFSRIQYSLAPFQSSGFDCKRTAAVTTYWHFEVFQDRMSDNALNDLWDKGQIWNGWMTFTFIRISITLTVTV